MTDKTGSRQEATSNLQRQVDSRIERVTELTTEINDMQQEMQELKLKLLHYERQPSNAVAYYLIFLGACALIFSIVWASQILAFIGLGLLFWGALLLYARPVEYLPNELVGSTAVSAIRALDQILGKLGYKGRSIYLPPMTLKDIKESRMFLPARDERRFPAGEALAGGALMSDNPEGIILVPPGLGLANLFEEKLGVRFAEVDLDYLKSNLPRLLVEHFRLLEDLELAEGIGWVQMEVKGSAYASLCSRTRKEAEISRRIGCPLCSAMAIILARTTHRPIVIEQEEVSEDEKKISVRYKMLME